MDFKKSLVFVTDILFVMTIVIALVKIFMSTLTTSDGLGLFVILTVSLAARAVDYKYPKRPDLFLEMETLTKQSVELQTRIENLESEMTGVRFGLKAKT